MHHLAHVHQTRAEMQPQTPSADVCTTLPPGNLPMRDAYPFITDGDDFWLRSDCGRVKIAFIKQQPCKYPSVPIGAWIGHETRIDNHGETWIKRDSSTHYVVDNFGFLARVEQQGGAA